MGGARGLNKSYANSRKQHAATSTRNGTNSFTGLRPAQLEFDRARILDENLTDAQKIRAALCESIRTSGKSRAQIAEEMTALAGRKVSERMLNGYTAESQEDYLFPADLTRSFCAATENYALLDCLADMQGLVVIHPDEAELLELGRAFLQREQADEEMAKLQRRLHGRTL